MFAITNIGVWVPWHDYTSSKAQSDESHGAHGETLSAHQNLLASVIETMFWGSSLASKLLSTTDPETDITADATNAIKTVAWKRRVMSRALR